MGNVIDFKEKKMLRNEAQCQWCDAPAGCCRCDVPFMTTLGKMQTLIEGLGELFRMSHDPAVQSDNEIDAKMLLK